MIGWLTLLDKHCLRILGGNLENLNNPEKQSNLKTRNVDLKFVFALILPAKYAEDMLF